jgi:hypothetical protein
MEWWGWAILIAANLPVYWLFGFALFSSTADFLEALKYLLTPDIISAIRGEWVDDQWSTIKVGFWLVLCVGAVWCEYVAIQRLGWI